MRRYLAFFMLALALGVAPGPDILFVFAQSLAHGAGSGSVVTCGLCTGLVVHVTLAAFGFAAVMKRCPKAFAAITWCGALYLAYLGIGAWRSAGVEAVGPVAGGQVPLARLYLQGVVMNLCNPKVILFFIALMPRFIVPGAGGTTRQFLFLGLLFIVATLVVFNGVSALGGSIAWLFDGDSGILRVLRYFSAVIILGLAGWIVVMNLRHRDRVGTDGDPRSGEGPAGA